MGLISASKPAACLLVLTLILVALPSPAWSQAVAVAEVSGTVTDPSGGALPTAQVIMTETSRQQARTTLTDSTGHYVLTSLPVGPYKLEVKANGFKDYVQTGIVLQVNNNIQINVAMQVGSISERVEVSATASMVETKENSISAVVDQQRINELPLNGRQATQLIMTLGAPSYGDAGDTGSKTFYSSTRISVAGGQGNGTAYLLDGGDNTDAMSNVNMPLPVPRRAAGVQRRDQRRVVALRHPSRRHRQRGHQVRIECSSTATCSSICATAI